MKNKVNLWVSMQGVEGQENQKRWNTSENITWASERVSLKRKQVVRWHLKGGRKSHGRRHAKQGVDTSGKWLRKVGPTNAVALGAYGLV